MNKTIPLIHKSAAIAQIEALKLYVKDIWPIVSDAQLPIYLDSTSAQFIPFHSLCRLFQSALKHLTATEFIEFIYCGAKSYSQHIEGICLSDKSKGVRDKGGLCKLVHYLPIQEMEFTSSSNGTVSDCSLTMTLEEVEPYTFISELYVISVAHHCLTQQYPALIEPIKYHLVTDEKFGLDALKASTKAPQFLGQECTALFYRSSNLLGFSDLNQHWRKQTQTFTEQVAGALESYIGRQEVSLDTFSSIVGIPPRTVQRHLGNEGQAFRKIKESLNMAFAKRIMIERNVSISDIAEHLGYSDTSQFIRAFKKSEKMTPLQWRKTNQAN
ncbi:helix-turn-helix domain-containing protein [Vibrio comitans]